jgi:hypothetical protein
MDPILGSRSFQSQNKKVGFFVALVICSCFSSFLKLSQARLILQRFAIRRILNSGSYWRESLRTVNGSPMSQRHKPSDWRRATSIAYKHIWWGEETFHSVCVNAISPAWMTCLITKSKLAFADAKGASSFLNASLPLLGSLD